MTDIIEVSAPGKVILHGEHAVVYGKAAIAANLDLRCRLKISKLPGDFLILELPDVDVIKKWKLKDIEDGLQSVSAAGSPTNPVPASEETIKAIKRFAGISSDDTDTKGLAVIAFLYIYSSLFRQQSFPAISVKMKSEIPVGAGLGSSAAFSVSLSASLLQLAGVINGEKDDESTFVWNSSDQQIINKWGFISEKVIHGRPSGIDNSVSTYGGAISFQKGEITHIGKMPTLSIMLVNTKVPRSTLTLVANFRIKYSKHKEIFDPVLDAIEAISEKSQQLYSQIHECPREEDYTTLGELMDLNHQFLNMMGVGHPSLDRIVSVAAKHNLHAKLTGAGGGGCAFVLVPPGTSGSVLEEAASELEGLGFSVWRKTAVGGRGVLRHF